MSNGEKHDSLLVYYLIIHSTPFPRIYCPYMSSIKTNSACHSPIVFATVAVEQLQFLFVSFQSLLHKCHYLLMIVFCSSPDQAMHPPHLSSSLCKHPTSTVSIDYKTFGYLSFWQCFLSTILRCKHPMVGFFLCFSSYYTLRHFQHWRKTRRK